MGTRDRYEQFAERIAPFIRGLSKDDSPLMALVLVDAAGILAKQGGANLGDVFAAFLLRISGETEARAALQKAIDRQRDAAAKGARLGP